MGCASSKSSAREDTGLLESGNREHPQSPNTPARSNSKPPNASRLSAAYTAKELGSSRQSAPRRKSSMPIDRSLLGTHTRHGIMPGPRGYVGAKINQDRGVVYWPYNNSFNEALLCVFDGHGSRGEKVAEICMEQIPLRLEADHAKLRDDPGGVLTSTVVQFDRELLSGSLGPYAHTCGTTSIIVYIRGGACWTACSGDSRAVLGRLNRGRYEAVDLSEDCKPDTPAEKERIHAAGGTVSPAQGGRPSRVWANGRIGLAMSRSIGDGECKRYGVIPDPEIKRFELQPAADGARDGDKFIIVASDGVWEFISSAEAVDIVAASGDASNACAELVQKAALRWKVNEGNYRDDITAIVAYLPFLQPSWDEEEEPTPEEAATPIDERSSSKLDEIAEIEMENKVFINQNVPGLSRLDSGEFTPDAPPKSGGAEAAPVEAPQAPTVDRQLSDEANRTFASRRLSLNNPLDDEEWAEIVESSIAESGQASPNGTEERV